MIHPRPTLLIVVARALSFGNYGYLEICMGFSLSHLISIGGSLGAALTDTTEPALRVMRISLPPLMATLPSLERKKRLRQVT